MQVTIRRLRFGHEADVALMSCRVGGLLALPTRKPLRAKDWKAAPAKAKEAAKLVDPESGAQVVRAICV